eukprot:1177932-Prorocentrum_minimum.AAC.5
MNARAGKTSRWAARMSGHPVQKHPTVVLLNLPLRAQGELDKELQAFPYPCCAIDASGHISKWNGSAERRTGFLQSELLDEPFDSLVDPHDREKILSALDEAEFNKLDITYNEVRKRVQGRLWLALASSIPLFVINEYSQATRSDAGRFSLLNTRCSWPHRRAVSDKLGT